MAEMSVVESIFCKAIEVRSQQELIKFLDDNCHDSETRREVERLLAAHSDVGSFLNEAAALTGATEDFSSLMEQPGTQIGPYKLMEQIGEGGFGLVFVAEQHSPVRRKVAIKVIKPGMDSRDVIARFEAERQALALMDHPNIAKVLDAGTTDAGRPYFVMELVKGIPIVQYCNQQKLDMTERLKLFVSVCQAVQHAHNKGVIHRDLKPSNIMVAPHDGVPVVKVIDFGVAKAIGQQLTEKTIYTRFSQMIGTPLYMSPEQAEVNALDVDTRSDIYSLGVLLYELLTGTTPFDKQRFATVAFDEMRRIIKEEDPPKPSTRVSTFVGTATSASAKPNMEREKLFRLIRGDLDWIVMKALEKDRERRYETAIELASDLTRYLQHKPILARPPSTVYRLRKSWRRNKRAFLAIAAVLCSLCLGLVFSTWQAVEASRARAKERELRVQMESQRDLANNQRDRANDALQLAQAERKRASLQAYAAILRTAQYDWTTGHYARLQGALHEAQQYAQPGFEWYFWQQKSHQEVQVWFDQHVPATAITVSGNGELVVGREDGTLEVRDLSGGEPQRIHAHLGPIRSVAISPDGKWIATGSAAASLKIWDARSLDELTSRRQHGAPIRQVAFSADSRLLASVGMDGTARIWSAPDFGKQKHVLGSGDILAVAFSPTADQVATADKHGNIIVWNTLSGEKSFVLAPGESADAVGCVAFSADGNFIATATEFYEKSARYSQPGHVRVWNSSTETMVNELQVDQGVRAVRFLPGADELLLVHSWGWSVWSRDKNVADGQSPSLWGPVFCLEPLNDGTQLIAGHEDGSLRVWPTITGLESSRQAPKSKAAISSVAVTPDGRHVYTGHNDGSIVLRDGQSLREQERFDRHSAQVVALAVSDNGQLLLSGSQDRSVRLWDTITGKELFVANHAEKLRTVAFSPSGRFALSGALDGSLRIWEVDSGETLQTIENPAGISDATFLLMKRTWQSGLTMEL